MSKHLVWGSTICLLFSLGLSAQTLSFGAKGGYPVTYSENSTLGVDFRIDSSSRAFIAGGTVELNLPLGLSVEGDFLYHPFNIRNTSPIFPTNTHNYAVFEVPVLAKLRLGKGFAKPFVDAGPEFRFKTSNVSLSHDGFVVGGGIEFKFLIVRVSPEFRYTRWANSAQPGANPNQAAVLLGVTF